MCPYADVDIVAAPPVTDQELGFVAATITDQLAAALARGDLEKRPRWWQRRTTR